MGRAVTESNRPREGDIKKNPAQITKRPVGPVCPECIEQGIKAWRKPHPKGTRSRCTTHWRLIVKARAVASHETRVQKVYNLPPGDYERLLAFQGGVCAITQSPSHVRRLAVDHNHDTGEVRGLLTRKANHDLLGYFTADDLRRALRYLEDPPYRRMLRGESS